MRKAAARRAQQPATRAGPQDAARRGAPAAPERPLSPAWAAFALGGGRLVAQAAGGSDAGAAAAAVSGRGRAGIDARTARLRLVRDDDPAEQQARLLAHAMPGAAPDANRQPGQAGGTGQAGPWDRSGPQATRRPRLPGARAALPASGPAATPLARSDALHHALQAPGAGSRLAAGLQRRLERSLGISLDTVRVHADADARRAARQIGARAFSQGERIFLADLADANNLALMAHEVMHVAQQRGRPEAALLLTALREPAAIVAGAGSAELDSLAAAFADTNLIAHQRALEALGARSEPEAMDLIASRVQDRWLRNDALDAALIFFLLHPQTALDVIGRLLLGEIDGSTPEELVQYISSMRASARGPAVDAAYRLLDAWVEDMDLRHGGILTRRMRLSSLRAILARVGSRFRESPWYDDFVVPIPAVARFVEQLVATEATLPLLGDAALGELLLDAIRIEIDADLCYQRIEELRGRLSELIVQGLPLESDEARFLREHLLAWYEAVLDAAPSATGMDALLARAESAYADQASLYQAFKVDILRQLWTEVTSAPYFMPGANVSGMRAQSIEMFDRFYAHMDELRPRLDDMVARHEAGERLDSTEIATVQRDLYILAIEGFANQHFARAHMAWEHLESIEGDVYGDFDDIQQRIAGYAARLHSGVMTGQLNRVVEVTQDFDYQFLFDFEINHAIETKRDQTLIIDLGILAVSMLAGGLIGLAVRGGGLLVFGARLGATGMRALSAASFLSNVAVFTLAHEGLSSAVFGHAFRTADLPQQFVENAVVFRLFGAANSLTASIGRGAEGALAQSLAFGARHGINLAIFGAGSAGIQLLKTGQLPPDWREFMVHTLATYVVIGVVGAGMHRVQAAIEPRLITSAMAERFARIDALEAGLREGFEALEGGGRAGERTLQSRDLQALREQAREYARETTSLMEFLASLGHVPAAEAEQVRAAADNLIERMDGLELTTQRATVIELRSLPGLTEMGDGVTFLMRSRFTGDALDHALERYREAGFDIETDPLTGEIRVSSELGLVARLLPGLAGEGLAAVLAGRGLEQAVIAPLVELPAEFHETLLSLHPRVLTALGEIGRDAPERLQPLLARLLAIDRVSGLLRGDPARVVEYVDMASAFEGLMGAEVHVHSAGAVPGSHMATAARLVTRLLTADTPEQVEQRFDRTRELIELLPEAAVGPRRADALADLAALRLVVEQALAQSTSAGSAPEAARLQSALGEMLQLPLDSAAEGPQVEAFFRLYSEIGSATWPSSPGGRAAALGRVAEGMRSNDVAYVELRHGSSEKLETALQRAGAIDAAGRPVADARVILTIPRDALGGDPARAQQAIDGLRESLARARADPVLARIIVGVDLSGVETAGDASMARFAGLAREIVRSNFESYERQLGDPALADADGRTLAQRVSERLDARGLLPAGEDVIAYGRRLMDALPGETTPEPRPQQAELALLNRAIADALREIGAERGELLMPPDIMGITMHAGEQLAGQASLHELLNICGESLAAGADRLGHGLVLGIPLPGGLRRLGFESFTSPIGRIWARRAGPGGGTESYNEADIAHMEALRVAIIHEAAALGVTVEVNPTSNLTLSGLSGAHPVAEMLDVDPALRIAVSTDNPAVHRISLGSELALLSLSLGGDFPSIVRVFLEGYASRLGGRSLDASTARGVMSVADIRANIIDGLVERTPPEQRVEVLLELNERYRLYGDDDLPHDVSLDEGSYRELLSPFVERTVY